MERCRESKGWTVIRTQLELQCEVTHDMDIISQSKMKLHRSHESAAAMRANMMTRQTVLDASRAGGGELGPAPGAVFARSSKWYALRSCDLQEGQDNHRGASTLSPSITVSIA